MRRHIPYTLNLDVNEKCLMHCGAIPFNIERKPQGIKLRRRGLMLIVVCIKQVPDTTQVQIDPVTNTLVREGIPFIANPYDTHALEEALRLKDKFGMRVAAISMGPPNAEATLRKALAVGVDEAILLSDRVFGGADTLATSNVLSAAIKLLGEKEEVGLVLCGKQTIDGDTAQVGPGIA